MSGSQTSIAALFGQLKRDGAAWARAELDVARAAAAVQVDRYRLAVILFAASALLILLALIGLVLGIVLTLATVIGPGLATLATVGGLVLVAIVLALIGKRSLRS